MNDYKGQIPTIQLDVRIAAEQIRSHLMARNDEINKMLSKSIENLQLDTIQTQIDQLVAYQLEKMIQEAIVSVEIKQIIKDCLIESLSTRRFNSVQQPQECH